MDHGQHRVRGTYYDFDVSGDALSFKKNVAAQLFCHAFEKKSQDRGNSYFKKMIVVFFFTCDQKIKTGTENELTLFSRSRGGKSRSS